MGTAVEMAVVQVGVAEGGAAQVGELRRAEAWEAAFAMWLREDRQGQARPETTARAYRAAWEDFRAWHGKAPWRADGLDVREWVEDLRRRPLAPHVARGLVRCGRRREGQVGYSAGTIRQWLAAIAAFYRFAEEYEVRLADGRTAPLFTGANPARSHLVRRPMGRSFAEASYLSPEQLRQLLGAIRSYSQRRPEKGLRDYALFLAYVATGGRSSEVRCWRWGELERRGAATFYRWRNKGKAGTDEVPGQAWAAVEAYLRLTGRWDGMEPEEYVFRAVSDCARRLRPGQVWDGNRPLSGQEVNRCLRFYARRAGLEAERLHTHSLRHSAYMLYREAEVPLEERSRLLHHSSLAVTTIYDHALAGQRNTGWARAADLLGL